MLCAHKYQNSCEWTPQQYAVAQLKSFCMGYSWQSLRLVRNSSTSQVIVSVDSTFWSPCPIMCTQKGRSKYCTLMIQHKNEYFVNIVGCGYLDPFTGFFNLNRLFLVVGRYHIRSYCNILGSNQQYKFASYVDVHTCETCCVMIVEY